MNVRPVFIDPPTILCFSHLRWNFVYQRPQHLLTRAARSYQVIYIEEPIFEDINSPALRSNLVPEGVRVVVLVIPRGMVDDHVTHAVSDLVSELICGSQISNLVLWYYTPMALPISINIPAQFCVYDNMDELSLFRGASPLLIDLEQQLIDRADIVFTGGLSLFEAKHNRHPNIHALPSSIDATHFGRARDVWLSEPLDQTAIKRPRLGFFGVIDERMDLELVEKLARMKPEWQLIMIGPVVKIDPCSLPKLPNIHWLGPKNYGELPQYLAGWDLGIMPFALNEATRFISPTKTPEYLAAGIPVISTPIRDVIRPWAERGLVEIAVDAEDFVEKAITIFGRERGAWLRGVDDHLATTSWDITWQHMEDLMGKTRRQSKSHRHLRAQSENIHV